MTGRRVVESSSGVGSLFAGGEFLGRVPYSLTVTEETVRLTELGGTTETTFELRSGHGRLVMKEQLLRQSSNALLSKGWQLVLQDGRRVGILIELASMQTGSCHFALSTDLAL